MAKRDKTLWGMYDGEPFMENPQLGILGSINPKKRGKKMAVRRKRRNRVHRRGRKANARRVRRTHRNPVNPPRRRRRARRRNWTVAGSVVPMNPRRRRRRSRMSNPRRRHHHRRRNPAFFGVDFPSVKTIAFAGIGFAGPSFVSGFLTTMVPTVMTTVTNMGILGKYVVRIGAVVGLAALTKRFVGSQEAQAVMIGGTANIALTAINDFVPGILPANPLALYVPLMQQPGVRSMSGMKQYVPLRGLQGGMGRIPTASPFPVGRSGAFGGSALRFQRY